jgi:hypothetical protein
MSLWVLPLPSPERTARIGQKLRVNIMRPVPPPHPPPH